MRDEREANQGDVAEPEVRSDDRQESEAGGAVAGQHARPSGIGSYGESAYLLKRIAHAADGHRTNDEVRILMQITSPYRPLEVATGGNHPRPPGSAAERVYGPYVTPEPVSAVYLKKKVVKVTVHFEDGSTPVDVTGADSLFWSMSAVEKFCLPWYAAQYGAPVAHEMWTRFANAQNVAALCHDPRSETCDVTGGTARIVGVETLLSEALVALRR